MSTNYYLRTPEAPTDEEGIHLGQHAAGNTFMFRAEVVHSRAADVVEQHLTEHGAGFRLRERAEDAVRDLDLHGLLVGDEPLSGSGTVREKTAAMLQCRYSWPLAERITASLAEAGLLRGDTDEFDHPRDSY